MEVKIIRNYLAYIFLFFPVFSLPPIIAQPAVYEVIPAISIENPATNATGAGISIYSVRNHVLGMARGEGVNIIVVDWIVSHESGYNLKKRGDDGNSRGLWQISSIYHPEVPDSCADDLKCSTSWALKRIIAGKINEWSTWKYRHILYENAPD